MFTQQAKPPHRKGVLDCIKFKGLEIIIKQRFVIGLNKWMV